MKKKSVPRVQDELQAWDSAAAQRPGTTPTDIMDVVSRDQSPKSEVSRGQSTTALPVISPPEIPLPVLLPAAVAATGSVRESTDTSGEQLDEEVMQVLQDELGDDDGWSRGPSVEASTQSDWIGPIGTGALQRSSGGISAASSMTGAPKRQGSSAASSVRQQLVTPTIPGASSVVKVDPTWSPSPSKKKTTTTKSRVTEKQVESQTESYPSATAEYVKYSLMRKPAFAPQPDALVQRMLKTMTKRQRGNVEQDLLLVSDGRVNIASIQCSFAPPVQMLRTSVLPPLRGRANQPGSSSLAGPVIEPACVGSGELQPVAEGPLGLVAPEELLEQDSSLMYAWTSNININRRPEEHVEDISFIPEVARPTDQEGCIRRRHPFHGSPPPSQRLERSGSRSPPSQEHQSAAAFRVPTREEFPLSSSLGPSSRVNLDSTLVKVLGDPKKKRRLMSETAADTVEGLVAEGFRLHRLFAAQLEHDGLPLGDFCREHKISPHHLASYLHIVSQQSIARQANSKPKHAGQLDKASGQGLDKKLLQGIHADDIRHVHRIVCDYIKSSLLHLTRSSSPSPGPTKNRQLSDDELAAAEGKMLREQWLAASRADGLTVVSFCELFRASRLSAALSAWLRDASRCDADVEALVGAYLRRRTTVKSRVEQLIADSQSSVAGFCNAHFLSLADVDGWLSGADKFDRQVVAAAWKLVIAADEESKLLKRRVEAKERSCAMRNLKSGLEDGGSRDVSNACTQLRSLRPPELVVKPRREASDPRPLAGVPKDKFLLESVIAHLQLRDEDDTHRAAIDCRGSNANRPRSWRDGVAAVVQKQNSSASPLPSELLIRQRQELQRQIGAPMADGYWRDVDPWAKGSYRQQQAPRQVPAGSSPKLIAEPSTGPDTDSSAPQAASPSTVEKVSERSLQTLLQSRRVGSAVRGAVLDAIEGHAATSPSVGKSPSPFLLH